MAKSFPSQRRVIGHLAESADAHFLDWAEKRPNFSGACVAVAHVDKCTLSTANAGDCRVAPIWEELSRRVYGFLDGVTLADIANGSLRSAPPVVPLDTLRKR